MKLYRSKVPEVARAIVEQLLRDEDIAVEPASRAEAETDIVAICEEYLKRDNDLRERVRSTMASESIGYDEYGRTRSRVAEEWNHPLGEDVEKFLARQVVENFMISRWVAEVFTEDGVLWRKVLGILRSFDVDERALRQEAQDMIKNATEGTVEYEMALQRAMRDVRRRHGLA